MKVTENNFIHELKCKNEEALDYIYSKYVISHLDKLHILQYRKYLKN
ncbi:hypothetical protein BD780_001168 [Clostridium tetanomorphum]|nr:hypothetical protein [Clostridium tetanomorphum]KAJ52397.1 hypothetical protein CTM_07861 [Clostridium tetanomorphum DSM 665]MBP1864767.1 hypothetical protein [Clostridium tetanomorphum]NRS83943.1 hypothetical protein [Clostridium tetanomorphum]